LANDEGHISELDLKKTLESYKANMTAQDIDTVISAFPGRNQGMTRRLDVSLLGKVASDASDKKLYDDIDLSDEEDAEFVDASGYTGVQHRGNITLVQITMEELVLMLLSPGVKNSLP